jgi:hypothetical protein
MVPVFISPRNRMAQLYPQALGSVIVASYDSQEEDGGGIRPRLHTGFEVLTGVFMNSSIFWVIMRCSYLLHAGFLLGLFFDPENRVDMFLRNFG